MPQKITLGYELLLSCDLVALIELVTGSIKYSTILLCEPVSIGMVSSEIISAKIHSEKYIPIYILHNICNWRLNLIENIWLRNWKDLLNPEHHTWNKLIS